MSELQQNIDQVQAELELAIYRKGLVDAAEFCRINSENTRWGDGKSALLKTSSALLDLAQSLVELPKK